MAEPKTKLTKASVEKFLSTVKDQQVREDCRTIVDIMEKATKSKAQMWGTNIVGFGGYVKKYANGKEQTWMLIAFAPRKNNIAIYLCPELDQYSALLAKLGKHKTGSACCLYIKRLSDVHLPTLKKIIAASFKSACAATATS